MCIYIYIYIYIYVCAIHIYIYVCIWIYLLTERLELVPKCQHESKLATFKSDELVLESIKRNVRILE